MKIIKQKTNFITKFFTKEFSIQGIVHLCNNRPVVHPVAEDKKTICDVKQLDKIAVEAITKSKATELAFDFFYNKYPELKGYIWLFYFLKIKEYFK